MLIPKKDFVLVELTKKTHEGSFELPQTQQLYGRVGRVAALGRGKNKHGLLINDKVMLSIYGAKSQDLELDGKYFRLLHEDEILMVML